MINLTKAQRVYCLWCVKDSRGFRWNSLSRTRKGAADAVLPVYWQWKDLRKLGYTVEKVFVSITQAGRDALK